MKSNIIHLSEADIRATIKALESNDSIDRTSVRKRRDYQRSVEGISSSYILIKCRINRLLKVYR
jgi:hypothetical protein